MSIWREKAAATDAALLSAVARGDHDAYAALYQRYGSIILGLLYRILRSRMEAEDVLQDVFLQVWRRARDFDQARGGGFVWLTTLARSRALDRLDLLASRQRTIGRAAGAGAESAPDPAELASSAEEGRRLLQALAEIPDAQRQVLLLAYFEGLTQSEIATRLDQPLGTVKSQARLGLVKLRQLLRARAGRRWGRR
jgi:RNA polymerase sigma-70 factor (ECF subfamily)